MRSHPSKSDLFKGRHFEQEIIVLCVRWYLRYKLSYLDLAEMMAERGLSVSHTTILRWVQRYAPEFDKCWSRFAAPTGTSWRVDETYVRIRGRWVYLYRAVDASGKTVDFRLSPQRNMAAAKAFFPQAVRSQRRSPETITLDGYAASHRAVRELQEQGRLPGLRKLRSSKYLNNLIEQDHRNVKSRLGTMLGLKSFASAAITIRGVELMHCIRKEQFDLRALATQGHTTPDRFCPAFNVAEFFNRIGQKRSSEADVKLGGTARASLSVVTHPEHEIFDALNERTFLFNLIGSVVEPHVVHRTLALTCNDLHDVLSKGLAGGIFRIA